MYTVQLAVGSLHMHLNVLYSWQLAHYTLMLGMSSQLCFEDSFRQHKITLVFLLEILDHREMFNNLFAIYKFKLLLAHKKN